MDYLLYITALLLLALSFFRDRKKTQAALKRAWRAFENLLPPLIGVMAAVGVLLAYMQPERISAIIGEDSGFLGTLLAAVVGSVTLIPGFIAFPTAALLLERGAGYVQIGVFVSTLMMVGIVTLPVEISYFGRKSAYIRNFMALLFSFAVAYLIGLVVPLL